MGPRTLRLRIGPGARPSVVERVIGALASADARDEAAGGPSLTWELWIREERGRTVGWAYVFGSALSPDDLIGGIIDELSALPAGSGVAIEEA